MVTMPRVAALISPPPQAEMLGESLPTGTPMDGPMSIGSSLAAETAVVLEAKSSTTKSIVDDNGKGGVDSVANRKLER